jgi:hypothetical protein
MASPPPSPSLARRDSKVPLHKSVKEILKLSQKDSEAFIHSQASQNKSIVVVENKNPLKAQKQISYFRKRF